MSETEKTFEEALSDLEKIVEELENGELTLEQSLERFQKGIELSKYCNKRLDEVERKISILIENEEGKLIEEVVKDA